MQSNCRRINWRGLKRRRKISNQVFPKSVSLSSFSPILPEFYTLTGVFISLTWKTMWFVNTCLIQRTKYSVSASVSCTGSEDLNNGPKLLNSGMAASCSAQKGEDNNRPSVTGLLVAPALFVAILPLLQASATHRSPLVPWNISWREGATFSGLLVTKAISVMRKAKKSCCQFHNAVF